jgi:DnaK suppressor protein
MSTPRSAANDAGTTPPRDLVKLKAKLTAERDRLAAELAELARDAGESQSASSGENNYRDHMADSATATFERERDLTLSENLRALLSESERAIARIDEGTYGQCANCGGGIAKERLAAHPAAELCIECKKQEEHA